MADPDPPTLALALQQLRTACGLTQEQLAERSSVSIRTISDIERGISRYPRRDTLQLLIAALHLDDDQAALLRPARYARPTPAEPAPGGAVIAPLIGRTHELQAVQAALIEGNHRLVTLTGPGGIGKTRLALEVIATVPPAAAADVTFIDLAPVSHAQYVPSTLAHALGVRERAEQSLSDALCEELAEQHRLLVLDNFEHVLAARSLLSMILDRCPQVRLLVTSRHPVEIAGEMVLEIPPLSTPDLRRPISPDLVLSAPAPALFIERARAVQPGFVITAATSRTIAKICARLGGIPLAIELAAAWSDRLSPQELLLQLTPGGSRDLLSLLTRRTHDGSARQHSMRDAAAWSYRLLDGREQIMFRRLGVFAGSWTLEAAEVICGLARQAILATEDTALFQDQVNAHSDQLNRDDQDDDLAAFTQLIKHGLVFAKPTADDALRFSMHTVIASYAQALLEKRNERATLARRHAEYFADLVERLEQALTGAQQRQSLSQLVDEYENIRAALRWAREHHEIDLGLRLAGALWWFWETRGYGAEGREWVEGMLALADEAGHSARDENVARALYCAAILAAGRHDYLHVEQFGRAFLAKTNQPAKRARMLLTLGNTAKFRGDQRQADLYYTDGLAILREQDDTRGMVVALNNLSALSIERGDLDRALSLIEESLTLKRQMGDLRGIAVSLINLGELRRLKGDMTAAEQTLTESLQIFQGLEDRQGIAVAHSSLGELAVAMGDNALAVERFTASLRHFQRMEDAIGEAQVLRHLGKTYARLGDAQQAEEYLRASANGFEAQHQLPEMLESLLALASAAAELGRRALMTQTLDTIQACLSPAPAASGASGRQVSLSPTAQAEYERLLAQIATPATEG